MRNKDVLKVIFRKTNLPAPETNVLGKPVLVESELWPLNKTVLKWKYTGCWCWPDDSESTKIKDKYIVVWKYPIPIDMKIGAFPNVDSYQLPEKVESKMSWTKTYYAEQGFTRKKVDALEYGFSYSLTTNTSVGLNIDDILTIGVSSTSTYNTNIKSTHSYEETTSYKVGTTTTFSYTNNNSFPIYISNDVRATYYVYIYQVYQIGYDVTTKKNDKFCGYTINYSYKDNKNRKLLEQIVVWESAYKYSGPSIYYYNSNNRAYELLNKESGKVYI